MKIYIHVVSEFKPTNLALFQPGDMSTSIREGTGLSVVLCYFVLIFSLYFRRLLKTIFKKGY
jgi:hypothetical protein